VGCSDTASYPELKNAPILVQEVPTAPVAPGLSRSVAATAHLAAPIDRYQQAIDRASRAFALSQSAQSQDDWNLVASRWQQAIELMATVSASSPQYAKAQTKILEYRQNANHAEKLATRSTAADSSASTVVVHSAVKSLPSQPVMPLQTATPVTQTQSLKNQAVAPSALKQPNVFYAPIIRREGNTPVIQVIFNNRQLFDMIVDTGASGTLITQQMAQTLGVIPVAAATVDTASQRGLTVPLGYVDSIEVNGALANNVLVAIAGPQLGTGLLGHDFFSHYDVTIRQNEVEFRERSR
jgi:hypothetical protein